MIRKVNKIKMFPPNLLHKINIVCYNKKEFKQFVMIFKIPVSLENVLEDATDTLCQPFDHCDEEPRCVQVGQLRDILNAARICIYTTLK